MIDYGYKWSTEQYNQAVLAANTSGQPDWLARRLELDARVAYRLGREFPSLRIVLLYEASDRIEKQRLWYSWTWAAKHLVRGLFGLKGPKTDPLMELVRREYGKVLSEVELDEFLKD